MKFGVREIANVVFKATANGKIGSMDVVAGQPVLYIESAKTSTLEGAATTVYAQGGRGNSRLIAWEGEKTLTFTVEDALLSPISFAILSGAGLIDNSTKTYNYHMTSLVQVGANGAVNLTGPMAEVKATGLSEKAPLFVLGADADGSLNGEMFEVSETITNETKILTTDATEGDIVFVDYYVLKNSGDVKELQIDAENFAGYYYVEADTLFRREDNGVDMPANITLPKVKVQSNFSFAMASTGDPSTFTFTMDALPGYTKFNPTKEVLCVIQVIDDGAANVEWKSVMDTDVNEDGTIDTKDVVKLHKNSETKELEDVDSYLNS